MVRGHHVFKDIWTPSIGEVLFAKKDRRNAHDRFAVSLIRDGVVVGHVPREFSKVAWHFLTHGGSISCEITGRRRRDVTARLGLVVPCVYRFEGKEKLVVRLREVFAKMKHSN